MLRIFSFEEFLKNFPESFRKIILYGKVFKYYFKTYKNDYAHFE